MDERHDIAHYFRKTSDLLKELALTERTSRGVLPKQEMLLEAEDIDKLKGLFAAGAEKQAQILQAVTERVRRSHLKKILLLGANS